MRIKNDVVVECVKVSLVKTSSSGKNERFGVLSLINPNFQEEKTM